MVNACCVKGCRNTSRRHPSLNYHRFPTSSIDLCKTWIRLCGIHVDISRLNHHRVCSDHFLLSDYLVGSTKLNPASCPSIDIPETLLPTKQIIICTKSQRNNYIVKITDSIVLDIQILIDETKEQNDYAYTVTELNGASATNQMRTFEPSALLPTTENTLKHLGRSIGLLKITNKQLRKQLKASRKVKSDTFQKKLIWKALYQKTFKEKKANLKRKGVNNDREIKLSAKIAKLEEGLAKIFSPKQIDVLINNKKKPKWTNREIGSAIPLRYNSNAYESLRSQGFPFPSPRTITRYTSKIDFSPGTIFPVINLLQQQFRNAPEISKICVISFDEMSIDSSIAYDPDEDKVYGPKSNINAYFIRGLFSKWKQLVAYDMDDSFTPQKYLDLVSILEHIGLHVVANVNDLGGKNRGLMAKLGVSVKKTRVDEGFYYDVNSSIKNPVSGNNIYFFADIPHLIKLLRNNLLNHGLTIKGGFKIQKKDYEHLLKVDHGEFRANWKLSNYHLNVNGREKQRVRPAVQMFSKTVAGVWRIAYPNRTAEADFIELVNDFFDIMNSRTPDEKLPMKKPFGCNESDQMKILDRMEDAIINLQVGTAKALFPFQRGILLSIYSMRGLFQEYVKESYLEINYILTHRLNQDIVENAFSMVRQMGSFNDSPSPVDAKRRFKLLMFAWSGNCAKACPVQLEDSEGYISGSMINCLIDPANTQPKNGSAPILLSEHRPEIDELTQENVEEVLTSMGLVQRFEESGKEYVAGFVASKFRMKFPELVASEEELLMIGNNSWVKLLSKGGLTIPSLSWRNNCQILYSEFYDFHRNFHNQLNPCVGVLKSFTISLVQKYPEIPEDPLKKFIQTIFFIRIKNQNKKLKEERIEKRKIISARIAERVRRSHARAQESIDLDYNSEDEENGEADEIDDSLLNFGLFSNYSSYEIVSQYETFVSEEIN